MGNELRYVCLVETRRLLLLMGVVFGFFLFVQYFKLPYINIFSSLFETSKSQVAPIDIVPSSNLSVSPSNLTQFSSSNSAANGVSNSTNVFERTDRDAIKVIDDSVLDSSRTLNDTLNDEIDPEDELALKDFSGVDRNSSIDRAAGNNDEFLKSESSSNSSASTDPDRSRIGDVVPTERNEVTFSYHETPIVAKSSPDSSSSTSSKKEGSEGTETAVVPLSKMNEMLLQSRVSYKIPKVHWSSPGDQELLKAKPLIENAPTIENDSQFDVKLYRNFSAFKRSYELMEQTLKVYIYAEGEKPIFHQPTLKGIYASEGWFMKLLKANKKFVTKKPKKAHLFYLPFSTRMLEVALYVPNSHDRKPLIEQLTNYVQMIKSKYNFWNRTGGADHFLVACHDWAPAETRQVMANCIRALCNADVREGFTFGKDASLPETFVKTPQNPLRQLGGKPPSQRRILAFFAGNMHGYLRPILLNYWENKDPDMKIFGHIRKAKGQMSYEQYMKSSKYCICAKGFEVNSPRVVEAIFYECVPVIISDNFVPPFFEALNWESFAVFVLEKDVPNLKNILVSIPKKRYVEMQGRVKKVQQHFLWHSRPVKYDVFHMVLHSIWYNRVFQMRP